MYILEKVVMSILFLVLVEINVKVLIWAYTILPTLVDCPNVSTSTVVRWESDNDFQVPVLPECSGTYIYVV